MSEPRLDRRRKGLRRNGPDCGKRLISKWDTAVSPVSSPMGVGRVGVNQMIQEPRMELYAETISKVRSFWCYVITGSGGG